jgi:geranylgeranyl diphosphate synthase type II
MKTRVENALFAAVAQAGANAPPMLAAALHHAVFPGGARVRPKLCLAVATACGDPRPAVSDAAATAIELLHCASLVHDDLPCFDDAATRRGRPSVHRMFGEPLAVLTGDGLIVLAFETLARAGAEDPAAMVSLLSTVCRAVGAPAGLVAGQAWESEPKPELSVYHQAKTGGLFTAATMCGAIAAGAEPAAWRALGDRLGAAYQVADDLLDVVGSPEDLGKPTLRDAALSRPSAVKELGVSGAIKRLNGLLAEAVNSIPRCVGADALEALVLTQAERLVPKGLAQTAA